MAEDDITARALEEVRTTLRRLGLDPGSDEPLAAPWERWDPLVLNMLQGPTDVSCELAVVELGAHRAELDPDDRLATSCRIVRQLTAYLALELAVLHDGYGEELRRALPRLVLHQQRAAGLRLPEWERLGIRLRVREDRPDVTLLWLRTPFWQVTPTTRPLLADHDWAQGVIGGSHADRAMQLAFWLLEGPDSQGYDIVELFAAAVEAYDAIEVAP